MTPSVGSWVRWGLVSPGTPGVPSRSSVVGSETSVTSTTVRSWVVRGTVRVLGPGVSWGVSSIHRCLRVAHPQVLPEPAPDVESKVTEVPD